MSDNVGASIKSGSLLPLLCPVEEVRMSVLPETVDLVQGGGLNLICKDKGRYDGDHGRPRQ